MKVIPVILAILSIVIIGSTSSAKPGELDAASPPTPTQTLASTSACPSDMVEINGDYCPDLEIECLYNVDLNGKVRKDKHGQVMRDLTWACGEYKYPTVCKSEKVHMRFCIDKYEWPNKEGQIPQDWMTWHQAKREIEAIGKRLCTAREWTLAAEGPGMHPVPYGDGYHRDSHACNFDRHFNEFPGVSISVSQAKRPDDEMSKHLRAFLVPSGSKPECHSDYGVYDMAGNIDELVINEGGAMCETRSTGNCISGLKGGHIWHVRNASRPMTTAHGTNFAWYETGSRACLSL